MKSVFNIAKVVILSLIVMVTASCGGKDERKAKYLEKGKAYLAEKNYKKAKIEFKNVLQIDPKHAKAYFYMGKMEERKNDLRRAIGNYKKAVELDPKYLDPKLKLARIFVLVGTKELLDKAIELKNDALALDADNLEANLVGSTIEYKTGDKKKAVRDIEKIVLKDLSLVEGVSLLSAIYDINGEKNKSINILEKGVAANKENIKLKLSLAKVYASVNALGKAEKELLDIINIDPESVRFRMVLAKFYTTIKQYGKAEKTLRDSIQVDIEDVDRYLALADYLVKNKSIEDAEKELLSIIKNNPDKYEFRFALIQLYSKTDRQEKEKEALKNIIGERAYDVDGYRARTLLARALLKEKNISEASVLLGEVLKEYPNDNDALFVKSKIALINGDALTAINAIRSVLKNQPANVDASRLLSAAHEMNKDYGLAEEALKNSIEYAPLDFKSHLNYATYLVGKKNFTAALNVLDKAILYFKDSYELLDLKLKIAAANKNEAEVLKIISIMKSNVSDRYEVYVKQGQYYLVKNKYPEAISEFEQALTKTNDKYKVLKLIVDAHIFHKSPEKAIERINERLKKHANDSISYHLLGNIYSSQKKYDLAINNYSNAFNNTKSWLAPYMGLAVIYEFKGDSQKAEGTYYKAIENVSNPSLARVRLAALYEKEKKIDKAIQQYELILTIDSTNKAVKNNIVSLLIDYKSDEKSISRAKELISGFERETHPALKDTLGWFYVKTGVHDKARVILTEVVEKSPDVAVFKYHLGVALNNLGDKALAKKYLSESVNSDQKFTGKDLARELLKGL